MKVPAVIQILSADNAAATLSTMLAYYKRFVSLEEARLVCPSSRSGTPPELFCQAAQSYGFETTQVKATLDELKKLDMPFVARWKHKYYVVVKAFKRGVVFLSDSAKGEYEITEEKFATSYSGLAIVLKPGPHFEKGGRPESLISLLAYRLNGIKDGLKMLLQLNIAVVLIGLVYVEGTRRLLEESTFAGQPEYVLWAALLVELLLLLLYTSFCLNKTLLVNDLSRKSAARSGSRLFKHILRLPMSFFDQASTGELVQRMKNNVGLDHSLILTIIPRFIDAGTALMYLILMFSYNKVVALACLAVEIAYMAVMAMQKNSIVLRARSIVTSSSALNSSVLNGLGTIDTIVAGGTERVFFRQWKQSQSEFQRTSAESQRLNARTQVISSVHNLLSGAALLFVGAHYIMLGQFDMAAMATMQTVVGRVGNSLSNCFNTLNSLQTMRTNIERVEDLNRRSAIEEIPLSLDEEPDKLSGELVLSHLTFRYSPADDPAIRDVSFSIAPGGVVALVGESGCGKSTLVKLIADLYTAEEGTITYGGKRRSEVPDVVFRSSVVSVDQEIVMFDDTVRNNLKMWDETIEDYSMVLAANDACIHERILREDEGYDSLMRENGSGFSGGEHQRIELARALECEPTILLLDEFTSALDTLTEERVMNAIRNLGATTVIVAHRLSTIRDADQIVVLDKGRIVAQGTHEELVASCDLYRKLVETE